MDLLFDLLTIATGQLLFSRRYKSRVKPLSFAIALQSNGSFD
jgi:hypothetical protein